jgi:hypothetical protein
MLTVDCCVHSCSRLALATEMEVYQSLAVFVMVRAKFSTSLMCVFNFCTVDLVGWVVDTRALFLTS